MKFRVDREVLAEAVAWTARSLPVRPPVPVLAGLLLEASPAGLTLSGFDYEVSARTDIAAEVAEEGRALVSGRLIADISRSLPAAAVEMETDGAKVMMRCGTARFALPTLPLEDYPTLPEMPSATGTVAGDVFAAAVSQVAVAAGRDDTLPVLTGVRVEIEADTVTLAATDRYRLGVRSLVWKPEQPAISAVALVPARTLADTARSLTSSDTVTLALAQGSAGEGLMGFEGGGRRTTTRLLEGEFPKYRSLLPPESSAVATVETSAFSESVKRVALVAERNSPIRLTFTAGELVLEAGTGDDAQATETLEAQLEGDDIAIAFNPTYLLDGLGVVGASYAQLAFTVPTKPAVLSGRAEPAGPADQDYRYLLMPVRLSG